RRRAPGQTNDQVEPSRSLDAASAAPTPNASQRSTLPMLRRLLPRIALVVFGLPFFCLGAAALVSAGRDARRAGERLRLVVWGTVPGDDAHGLNAQLREFERRNPGIHVVYFSVGSMDFQAQKLMTSIVGNAPPDV